jgi:hypothetical protein
MPDLAGRGALGQKPPKPTKKPRKAVRKRSAKREAYMRSDARVDAVAHMMRVKALPCVCCGHHPPSHAHHVTGDGKPRDDLRVIPLCPPCHVGPDGYHKNKAAWVARHGPDYGLLGIVAAQIDE